MNGHAVGIPNPALFCFTDVQITQTSTLWPDFNPTGFPNYACIFPFTYQGKEYDICVSHMSGVGPFCAIPSQGEDGYDCPKCWKNETYKIGHCEKRKERCQKVPPSPGKTESNGKYYMSTTISQIFVKIGSKTKKNY